MRPGDTIAVEGRGYEAVERLGAGRTAEVWLLRAADGSERVVKQLRDDARDAIDPAAFMAEADVLDRLRAVEAAAGRVGEAAHFPRVDLRDEARCRFVMERAPGLSLDEVVGRRALSIEQCLWVAGELATALEAAIEAGIYNADLKLDSVRWDRRGRLMVIDWNVCRTWPPDDHDPRWIDPYLAMVAGVLDGLLDDLYHDDERSRVDWSRPPRQMPARWGRYPRVFQLTFSQIVAAPGAADVAGLRARLAQIEAALTGEPELLLREVVEALVAARDDVERHQLEEALAFAELAVNVHHPGVVFRGQELIGQAVDLLGDEAEALDALRRAVRGESDEVHARPGDTIEWQRLKRLAYAGHDTLGATDALRRVLDGYERLHWQAAGRSLDEVLQQFGHREALVEELRPLADELAGLGRAAAGLKLLYEADCLRVSDGTMHGYDPAALHALERDRAAGFERAAELIDEGLARLRVVPWYDALTARFPDLDAVAAQARAEAQSAIEASPPDQAPSVRRPPPPVPAPQTVAAAAEPLGLADSDDVVEARPRRWGLALLLLIAAGLAAAVWMSWPASLRSDSTGAGDAGEPPSRIKVGSAAQPDAGALDGSMPAAGDAMTDGGGSMAGEGSTMADAGDGKNGMGITDGTAGVNGTGGTGGTGGMDGSDSSTGEGNAGEQPKPKPKLKPAPKPKPKPNSEPAPAPLPSTPNPEDLPPNAGEKDAVPRPAPEEAKKSWKELI